MLKFLISYKPIRKFNTHYIYMLMMHGANMKTVSKNILRSSFYEIILFAVMLSNWQQKQNIFSAEGKSLSIDANYLKHDHSSLFCCLHGFIVFTRVKVLLR